MKNFTIIFALLLSMTSFAFRQGQVEIFSPSGESFYVILNGTYQNYHPKTSLKFKAISNNHHNVRVVSSSNRFSFNKYITVQPNMLSKYRIERRNGHYKLRLISQRQLQGRGTGMQSSHHHFNHLEMNDHHTCQHMTHQCSQMNAGCCDSRPYYTGPTYYGSHNLMDHDDMRRLKNAIKNESFSSDRLRVAKAAVRNKRLTVNQIKEVAELFTFSNEKLAFVKAAYATCVNKDNYYELYDIFTFSSDKRKLNEFINNQ